MNWASFGVRSLPRARGEVSEALLGELIDPPHRFDPPAVHAVEEPLADDDLHLALYCCYELHYRGLSGVASAGSGIRP